MSMHLAIRRLPVAAVAVGASALIAACGGSGAGLIPTANAGPLARDFEEVGKLARAGNCAGTKEALEKTESEFEKVSPRIASTLRRKLQEGMRHLHDQALAECAQVTTTTSTTTKTHTSEVIVPATSTSSSVTSAAPPSSSASNGEEGRGGGGTEAPGENGNPGGAEAQGAQPGENAGGGRGNRGEGR